MRVPPTCHSSAVLRLHCYVCRSGSHTSTKQMNALWLQQTAHEPRAVHGCTPSSEEQKRRQEDLQRHSNSLHRCVHRSLSTPSVRGGPGLDRTITAQPLPGRCPTATHTHTHCTSSNYSRAFGAGFATSTCIIELVLNIHSWACIHHECYYNI